MAKTVFFGVKKWEREYIEDKLGHLPLEFFSECLDDKNVNKVIGAEIVSVSAYSLINKEMTSLMKDVRYISTRSTGHDHIASDALKENGTLVSNIPNYGENTVAEHAFSLLLYMSRKIRKLEERTKAKNFYARDIIGFDLRGKVIGVVGVGNIGQHAIKIAKGLGMEVVAYDVKEDKNISSKLGFRYVSFHDLLRCSQIITLHVPYNKSTHHLINMKNLDNIRKGCYLINTSRGKVCDTTALLKGLDRGIFAGLGLDVLEEEELIRGKRGGSVPRFLRDHKMIFESSALLADSRVIITPHVAYNTKEAVTRMLDSTIENIVAFKKGEPINLL